MSPGAAFVLGLHSQDGTTQEVAGTIPPAVFLGDRTDERGQMLPRVNAGCD